MKNRPYNTLYLKSLYILDKCQLWYKKIKYLGYDKSTIYAQPIRSPKQRFNFSGKDKKYKY